MRHQCCMQVCAERDAAAHHPAPHPAHAAAGAGSIPAGRRPPRQHPRRDRCAACFLMEVFERRFPHGSADHLQACPAGSAPPQHKMQTSATIDADTEGVEQTRHQTRCRKTLTLLGNCNAGIVGPALSALDAHIGYVLGAATRAKDAKRSAQHAAAAQEARSMLGGCPQ